ncbi:uncharacterized protein NPIL_583731 [Nephila pilipes]|uniref:Uncharacterized protein n=1 Tax=Nephila pilipes TaxID=299642 RepID=A0A8X6TA15_NEPPI|nr:uncharacterized protein NPIL_583731 [Nephila pilipes]
MLDERGSYRAGTEDSYRAATDISKESADPKEKYFTGKIKLDEVAESNGKHPDLPDEERHGTCSYEHCIVDEWTGQNEDRKRGSSNWSEATDARSRNDKPGPYDHVNKWEVDYTNRNYVRSKCNKPTGLHRYILGRQYDWDVDYDNTNYHQSQVHAPKGLHRLKKDPKRKFVPDDDPLGDSTGWEFAYGPEFFQAEGDVQYMPEERVVSRGAYRSYGVRRNNSDEDIKTEDKRQKIPGYDEEEYKYGPEFFQDDVQHIVEQKDGRIGRGGYRYYDTERNVCDKKPCDTMGIDYRESRATMEGEDDESGEDDDQFQGRPFKRTVLKKTLKFNKRPSDEHVTALATPGDRSSDDRMRGDNQMLYGAHLKFVPGLGSTAFYQGMSVRDPDLEIQSHPSIRNVFTKTKKVSSFISRRRSKSPHRSGDTQYSHKDQWKGPRRKTPEVYREMHEEFDRDHARRDEFKRQTSPRKTLERSPVRERTGERTSPNMSYGFNSYDRTHDRIQRREKGVERFADRYKSRRHSPERVRQRSPDVGYGASDSERAYARREGYDSRRDISDDSSCGVKNCAREILLKELQESDEERCPDRIHFASEKCKSHIQSPKRGSPRRSVTRETRRQTQNVRKESKRSSRYPKHRDDYGYSDKGSSRRSERSLQGMQMRRKTPYDESDDEMEFRKHEKHPNDFGKLFDDGYERFISENGSEIWVKTEEKYSELHHRA